MSARYDWARLDPPLQALYSQPGRMPPGAVRALAATLGVPVRALWDRAAQLRRRGVLAAPARTRWRPAEDAALLRAHALGRPLGRVGAARGPHAARGRIAALGLRAGDAGYSLADLACAVGVAHGTVRYWVRAGYLRTGSNGRAGAGRRHWLTDAALHAFFCTYPQLWQRHPCPDRDWITSFLTDPRLARAHGCARPGRLRTKGDR